MDSIGGAMGFGYACQKCGTPLANAIAEMEHRCLPSGTPAVPPTPTSVEEARQKAYVYDGQSDNVEEVDALIAAVRSSMLREVREMVEKWCAGGKRDPLTGYVWVDGLGLLAELAKMETP